MSIVLVQFQIESDRIRDFEWFIYLANVVSFFWGLGLKNAFMTYFPKLAAEAKERLIFNIGLLFLVFGCLAFVVVYAIDLPRMASLYSYLPWLFCFMVLGTTASLSEHILIVKQKSKELFYYAFASYSVYFFGLSFLVYYFGEIQPLLIGLGAWACLRFIYFVYLIFDYGSFKIDFQLLTKFLFFGSPLIVHILMGAGMEYVDGYLVNAFFEKSDFTYYRYGARELPINTIFITALASAFIPLAVTNLDASLLSIKERTSRLMNFLFPISMGLILLSPYIFSIVYSEEYLVSAQIFNIYLLIICSRMLLPQVVIYAKHKNSFLMFVSIIEFGINICLSLYLMKYYGLYGIAFATVIAFFAQKILLVIYAWSVLNVSLSKYIDIPKYLLFTAALYATFCFSIFFLK